MENFKKLLDLDASVLTLGLASCGKTSATSNSGSIGGNSTPSESVKPSDSTDPVVYETEVYLRTSFNNWGTNEIKMNKKLFGIIFAFVLIFFSMICLSSCGGEPVKINSIYVKINEEKNGYLGSFDYGQQIDFSSIKIFAQYSDETEKDVTKDESLIVTYSCDSGENKPFSELGFTPDVGRYEITFKYSDYQALVNFNVQKTQYKLGYKISLNKQYWNYDQAPSTIDLVTHPDDVENYSEACFITKEKYDVYVTLETEEEKEEFLSSNSYAYLNEIYAIAPGEYYAYARFSETTNYQESLSDFVKFSVYKGTLTKTSEATCNASSFTYTDQIGDITLDSINLYNASDNAQFVDANGEAVRGVYTWSNPEIQVNYSKSGSSYSVKFVPNDDYWNVENYGLVSISIEQGQVEIPSVNDPNDITYSEDMSQLDLFEIYNHFETYLDFINITKSVNNGDFDTCNSIERSEKTFFDNSVNKIGKYQYKLSLKDKVNYCWSTNSSEDLIFTYNVIKKQSYIAEEYNSDSWVVDSQRKVKIEIDTTNASYQEGTLKATRLEFLDNYDTPTPSTVDCTFDIVQENKKTYLIVNINAFSDNANYGTVGVNITATGINNYEDIDYKFNISICKYDAYTFLFNARNSFEAGNDSVDANRLLYMPVGTQIMELFKINNYDLSNDYGEIKVEISTDEENWKEVTSLDKVTELYQTYVRFVFISNNEICCESITDTPKYLVLSDYSKSRQTMKKDILFPYVSSDASGIWLYFDVSQEPRGNVGWEITITASNVSTSEIPTIFNVYASRHQDLITIESLPNATIANFVPTLNSEEYSLTFGTSLDYHIFIYVEFSGAADVNISYSVAPKHYE